ncbi:hypothetical protein TEA_012138 [Camellia sinensis var. sinensis]|uniref:BAR domain-containing protein n=1 Tax=Camellia sinensis var. sinensis TaxID=542762 RepID=A0A4S4EA59_CAMSN|nr:hypothetical protein TEA_012138 [Camellia sinensis var. sinensis]
MQELNMHFEELVESALFRQQESKFAFAKLDDSPMFRQQMDNMSQVGYKLKLIVLDLALENYLDGLGEGYDRDIAFASALESFGGQNDPICASFGGPVMTKFAIALREIGTYKEVLRSQIFLQKCSSACVEAIYCQLKVELMLNDRLLQLVNVGLHDVKEARKRFDKANVIYDQCLLDSENHLVPQAREKYLSLRKSSRLDIAAAIEEIGALAKVEEKKRFEFLEVVSGAMDAHLHYFKQGYELLHQLEPYINQV